jgi:hypothetical protein
MIVNPKLRNGIPQEPHLSTAGETGLLKHSSPPSVASGLSRSTHYQSPHLVPEAVLAQSTAFERQQRRRAASAVTNSLRQATSDTLL